MLTFEVKNQAQRMLLDLNHFIIIGQDFEAGFNQMRTYNPTPEMFQYLLELNPWLEPIFQAYNQWIQEEGIPQPDPNQWY